MEDDNLPRSLLADPCLLAPTVLRSLPSNVLE